MFFSYSLKNEACQLDCHFLIEQGWVWGMKGMCSRLCNNEPNVGVEAINPSIVVTESGIVPWINQFYRLLKKGIGY